MKLVYEHHLLCLFETSNTRRVGDGHMFTNRYLHSDSGSASIVITSNAFGDLNVKDTGLLHDSAPKLFEMTRKSADRNNYVKGASIASFFQGYGSTSAPFSL